MNDEIREILDYLKNADYSPVFADEGCDDTPYKLFDETEVKLLLDYITNLQKENERLKEKLNCKEYFSSTMPEGTEFVILTKNNYDRQQKDIQLELIDYKSRVEKAVENLKLKQIRYVNESDYVLDDGDLQEEINILQNGSDASVKDKR